MNCLKSCCTQRCFQLANRDSAAHAFQTLAMLSTKTQRQEEVKRIDGHNKTILGNLNFTNPNLTTTNKLFIHLLALGEGGKNGLALIKKKK